MKKKINTIIIGLGRIGIGYDEYTPNVTLTHYKAIKKHKNFKLIGCIDVNKINRDNFIKKYKIPCFKNLSEIKDKIYPELAIIASPTDTHYWVIKEILKNHKKITSILCEKPFGSKHEDANKILQICKKNKVKLFVNYMRTADPGVIKTLRIIRSKFNKNCKGTVFYDGNTLNQASHLINLLQFWFGESGSIKLIKSDKGNKQLVGQNFILSFINKSFIFIGLNFSKYSYASIEIISPTGRIHYLERGEKIQWQKIQKDMLYKEDNIPNKKIINIKNDMKNCQLNVLNQLYSSLIGKKSYLCEGYKAIQTLKLINKII
jgi:predicted dehydrogenase